MVLFGYFPDMTISLPSSPDDTVCTLVLFTVILLLSFKVWFWDIPPSMFAV